MYVVSLPFPWPACFQRVASARDPNGPAPSRPWRQTSVLIAWYGMPLSRAPAPVQAQICELMTATLYRTQMMRFHDFLRERVHRRPTNCDTPARSTYTYTSPMLTPGVVTSVPCAATSPPPAQVPPGHSLQQPVHASVQAGPGHEAPLRSCPVRHRRSPVQFWSAWRG